MIPFAGWPKIGRLKRDCIITEKIDGTCGSIFIMDDMQPLVSPDGSSVPFLVGSRTRWITPKDDNAGFCKWCHEHREELLKLGPGHHFGEWWGQKIQRTYGLKEKRFSLFNTTRWMDSPDLPMCCGVVPVLYEGEFTTDAVDSAVNTLRTCGSAAVLGFMDPEGVVVFLKATNHMYKVTLDNDHLPKTLVS